ncbi:TRAP transporter substrate-binding protein [Seohaeicola zhoushanensis]|uniref:C4-dicarboxylate ABC transporter n=1 Tax=Seohaeicola zhoushanensis TaxID=1569283 RepID=A0A8J3H1L4_9RHOB|nr:TRAP transporter substrate-binding protein [Seohaeicola zhoushanensis]GHF64368.1 C4-dicarboxylate ABC transporter [Seohaeicola zhoushanensis]
MFDLKKTASAIALGLALAAPAAAQEVRIAVQCPAVPACSDWVYAEDFAAALREGGMEATVFAGASLGKDPEIVDQLSQGLLQFGVTNFVMIAQVDPRILGFLAPYVFEKSRQFFRATQDVESPMLDDIRTKMQAQGVMIAGLPGLGGQMGLFNAKKDVASVEDLTDLRLRAIDANQVKLFEAWGTQGVVVDMPEFAGAVQQGIVDGYFNPPAVPLIFKHTEFLTHFTDLKAGTPFRAALMSADWYEGLGDDQKKVVDGAVETANAKNREWTYAAEKAELGALEKAGVKVVTPSPEALAEFKRRSQEVWDTLMPQGSVADMQALADASKE